ncbi:MAG: hypothetical protein P1U63_12705 [Coxiellaceae bacterium]|nr:hypothetical protein [Coxiellaceae bacterium]
MGKVRNKTKALRRQRELNLLQAEARQAAEQKAYQESSEGRRAMRVRWMQARPQTQSATESKQTPPALRASNFQPAPASAPVGVVIDTGTRLGMGAFLATLASKPATKYLMEPSAQTHHFNSAHFAAFSYVGVMMVGGWAYSVAQTAKSPNVNRHQLTSLSIQTGVAATIGTTVFGGFAKKALAAGGPIAFLVVNSVMFVKSLSSAVQNYWHARKLSSRGKMNSRAYQTYVKKGDQHLKAAGLHAVGVVGTAILITFAPVIAIGWTIATAAVSAIAQVAPIIGRFFSRRKKANEKKLSDSSTVTNNTNNPNETVMHGARVSNHIEIKRAPAAEQKQHTDAVKAWSETHERLHRDSGVRSYDLRHHYRHALFHPVTHRTFKQSVVAGAPLRNDHVQVPRPQPRDPSVMKARMLGVLQHAIDKAKADLAKDPNTMKEGMLQRKLRLATVLYETVRSDTVTVDGVHKAVKANKGNMFQLSALSSFKRRVGHMQSVVESVEYYAAWLDAYQHGKAEVDHSNLRYQHDDDYLIEAKCLQHHQNPTADIESKVDFEDMAHASPTASM